MAKKGEKISEKTRLKMSLARLKNPIRSIGSKNYFWTGGKYISKGYVKIWKPEHPNCDQKGYVLEHRLKMEEKIGRYLSPSEIVHHIDENKSNNDINNLELMGKTDHDRMHTKERHLAVPLFGR